MGYITQEWMDAQDVRLRAYNEALTNISRKAHQVFGPDCKITIRDDEDGIPMLWDVR